MKVLATLLMLATLGTVAARADSITVTFDNPNQVGSPGETLQFFGTITNDTDATLYLNSDSLNILGLSLSTNDLIFVTVPPTLAASGQAGDSSGDIELFDVMVSDPLLDATGNYAGGYTPVGGADADAQDNLGTAVFSVTTVPEPGSICLLLTGLSAGLPMFSNKLRRRLAKRNG